MLAPAVQPIHGWETGCKVGIEPQYSFLPCEDMQYRLALLAGHTLDTALPEAILSGLMV